MGKTIAAYERTILPPATPFDEWVASKEFPRAGVLSEDEIAGLRLFLGEGECVDCQNGPLLTDNHFHNTGVPAVSGLPEGTGRLDGTRLVLDDEFNCLSPTTMLRQRTAPSCASWPSLATTPCAPSSRPRCVGWPPVHHICMPARLARLRR